MSRRRRFAASLLLTMVVWLLGIGAVSAHPLGNATVSRALAVEVGPDQLRVVTIVDMAEIPAFTALQEIDTDDDGAVEVSERNTWAVARCDRDRQGIAMRWDGRRLVLRVSAEPVLSFPDGLGGLETLRLECSFSAVVLAEAGEVHRIEASGMADDDRPGWREVTIAAGSGIEIVEADVPAVSPSQALTVYPEDLLTAPLDVSAGSALVSAADSMGQAGATVAPGSPGSLDRPVADDALVGILTQLAGTGGALGGLLALLLSAGLGAIHALSPGHGKALVAASLVGSRGTARQAVGLALVVAASHTGGVLVLGAVVLGAGEAIAPDRLLAWLSLVAGACVVAVGASLVLRATAPLRGERGPERSQRHAHGDRHEHHHSHGHGHADSPRRGPADGLSSRGIVGLGLFGGLVPSTSAIIVLLLAVTTGQLALGLALILAFGLGMAVILGGIALASVMLGRRMSAVGTRPGLARVIAAIPMVSGGAVLIAGTAMTVGALSQVL